jgi:GNAT superfamily N-acetyltransferase
VSPASDRTLMRLHIEALFTHDAEGNLDRINEPNGAPAPRLFVGRTVDGVVRRFRHDVALDTRRALDTALHEAHLERHGLDSRMDPAPYEAILGQVAPVKGAAEGPAFLFPDDIPASTDTVRIGHDNAQLLRAYLESWLPDVDRGVPMFAVVIDGHAVAVCASVRQTAEADEAGVDTAPSFRGRGFAGRVVAAWARTIRSDGRIPLYSTSWTNEASRAVARKLGLAHFGSDFHIT